MKLQSHQSESKKSEEKTAAQKSTSVTATTEQMPSTGPEEFLPLALVAGTLVMYLSSAVLAKREA